MTSKRKYRFKEGECVDEEIGAKYRLLGKYEFQHGVPFVFTNVKSELGLTRIGYRKANLLDLLKQILK